MPIFQDFTVIATLVPLRHDPDVGSSGFDFRGMGDIISASTDVTRDKHGDGWRELPSGDFIKNDRLGAPLLKAVEVAPPPPPPFPLQPIDAVVSDWSAWVGDAWSPCVNGLQTRTETSTRTVIAPAQNGGLTPLLVRYATVSRACTVSPPPPPPPDPLSHPYFLNVAVAALVYNAPNRGAAVLGAFPPDPAWRNPIYLSAGLPLSSNDRMWRQVLNCSDPKLIGGWVVEGEPGYSVRYFYQPPQ